MGEALTRLVHDRDRLAAHWESEPFVTRGAGDFDDVFSLSELDRLLTDHALPVSTVRLLRDGRELDRKLFARPRERASEGAEPRVDAAAVRRAVADGATLVLEELQSHCPAVRDFTDLITAEIGWPTYTTAFRTPAGCSGAAVHYDTVSVFVRQLSGTKRWRIGRPPRRWPAKPWDPAMALEFDEVLDVTLAAGDCLYLPRGYLHVAQASDAGSLHVTIGLVPVTWLSALLRLIEAAAPDELRAALPMSFHTMTGDDLHPELTSRIDAIRLLLDRLDQPRVADIVRRTYAPSA